jgi:hypothetical protein
MLSRFLQRRTAIQKSLIDQREMGAQRADADFLIIREVVSSLVPVKLVAVALRRRDTNLCTAEAAANFCIVKLGKQSSSPAKTLASALKKRMNERRAAVYLHYTAAASTDVFVIPSLVTQRSSSKVYFDVLITILETEERQQSLM